MPEPKSNPLADPFHPKNALLDKLVSVLLYAEGSAELLVARCWEEWTPEQRKEVADRVHAAALERAQRVTEAAVRAPTSQRGSVNLFDKHLTAAANRAFENAEVAVRVEALVATHLESTLRGLRERLLKDTEGRVKALLGEVVSRIDANEARRLLTRALTAD